MGIPAKWVSFSGATHGVQDKKGCRVSVSCFGHVDAKRAETGFLSQPAKGGQCVGMSESGYHHPTLENLGLVTRSALFYPEMMCAVPECEIVVERGFHLQPLHACTEFVFAAGEKYRVHYAEIDFRRFVAITAKGVFDYYVHDDYRFSSTMSSILPCSIERNAVLSVA